MTPMQSASDLVLVLVQNLKLGLKLRLRLGLRKKDPITKTSSNTQPQAGKDNGRLAQDLPDLTQECLAVLKQALPSNDGCWKERI